MTSFTKMCATIIGFATALGAGSAVCAQSDADIEAAMTSRVVGEQADGYLGFATTPNPKLRAEVEAINIKRRAAYTNFAQSKNVTVDELAASIGCQTLGRLGAGRVYSVAKGVWAVKGTGPVRLPSVCR